MTGVLHLVVIALYVAAAAGLGALLHFVVPAGILAATALGTAAAAIAACLHMALTRRRAAPDANPEIEEMRRRIGDLADRQEVIGRELAQARGEARQIYEALSEAGRAGSGLKDVIGEVRMLHRLVEQLQDAREVQAAPVPAPRPPSRLPSPAEPDRSKAANDGSMIAVVQEALGAGRIDLVLQPIVALPQRRRRFFECFSRIRDEAGTVIMPESYLGAAAASGLLPAIDNLLLFRCIQMIRKARQRNAGIGFFCNVSGHSLADRDFLDDVSMFLEDNRDLASNVILEIAQDALDLDDEELRSRIGRLGALGLSFSLDNVTRLPLDYPRLVEWHIRFVKIAADRFSGSDPEDHWEGSLFQLHRMLALHGIELIVDRIETDRQLVELLEFNIPYGQGFLFGEPKPAPEA